MTALSDANLGTELLVEKPVRAFAHFNQNEPGYTDLWLANQVVPEGRAASASWGALRQADRRTCANANRHRGKQSERVAFTPVHSVSAVISLASPKAT